MNARDVLLVVSSLSLSFTGFYYGKKFLKLGNNLLGWEWIVLGFSASNMALAAATKLPIFEAVSYFCDAFSRGFGFPVIAVIGFVELFRRKKYPWQIDAAAFASGGAFAWAARTVWQESTALQQYYLVAGSVFEVCMIYFTVRLLAVRLLVHGMGIIASLIVLFVISLLEGGSISIPGEETNILFNWLTIAEFVWALAFAQFFYAYRAYDEVTKEARR